MIGKVIRRTQQVLEEYVGMLQLDGFEKMVLLSLELLRKILSVL